MMLPRNFYANSKDLVKIAFPVILAQLGTVLLGITDTIMLGWIGKEEIAAIGIANQVYFVITVIGMGCMSALTTIVAYSKGKNNFQECGEYLRSGIEMGFLLSVGIVLVLFLITENFHLLGQSEAINFKAKTYLRVLNVSTFPLMLFLAFKQYADGLKLSRFSVWITFAGVLLNILLNYIFIKGLFTFPILGIKGVAVSTLIVRMLMALAMVLFIFPSKKFSVYLPPLISTFQTLPIVKKMFKIGIPTGLQMFFEVASFAIAAIMVGIFGPDQLAAHQIVLAYAALTYMISVGIATAGSIEVSTNYGKKDFDSMKTKAKTSLWLIGLFMFLITVLFVLGRNVLPILFIHDDEVVSIASILLVLVGFFQFSDGIQTVSFGLLRGIEDVTYPTYYALIVHWFIIIPVAYVLAFWLGYNVYGVWLAMFVGLTVSALAMTKRLFLKFKNIN